MSAAEKPNGPTRREVKISWRRQGWGRTSQDKCRTYMRLDFAHAFLAKLRNGQPGLSPVVVRLHAREVGPWRPIDALPTVPTTEEQS